ncbi:ribonuclease [Flavobacterium suncheonense GH29-5 = DSM 17707]|uniref:Ribonuclease n=1 Tax=Flavobacterium suncheonense GH29-5 = DSM 17707 TaxID=1121899 RepID=A0A0A2M5I7_9FLAO|nr:ribonuclease [Flavobacterium suncheonense GH29-5 = DSM 17707]
MKKLLLLFVALVYQATYGQVVINEIDSDTPGTDQLEFVELKSETPNFPLDGYVLVFFNGGSSAPYSGTSCYYAFDLDGYTTDVNGIAHFGNNQVTPSPMGIFPNNTIQNGPDVVALYLGNASDFQFAVQPGTPATATNLIDAVAHNNTTTVPANLMSILGITVCSNENANGLGTSQSIQRKNDGTYEVKAPTPGANNDGSGVVLNYISVAPSIPVIHEGDSFNFVFTTSQPVQNENLIFNFTLNNGNFNMSDFSGGLTVMIPVGETTGQTGIIIANDGLDEGDEEMKLVFQPLPFGYVANNNNIIYRVYDANYVVQPYGTPINPTYGLVTPTIPPGYYDSLEGLSGDALKQALQDIIANPAVVRAHNYGDIWEILQSADVNPENSNQVWMYYVEAPRAKLDRQTESSGVGKWVREHVFAQARGGFSGGTSSTPDGINVWLPTNADDILAAHADAHHLHAEDGVENGIKSNKDFGLDAYNGPAGTQGKWKGDIARALFYMAVRYNALSLVNGNPPDTSGNQIMGDLATLLTWNHTDPRDDFEMNRNNYIYTWQMNRNPFIDYPNLADYIWGPNVGQPWSATLSTGEFAELKLSLYPNPASESITIAGVQEEAVAVFYNMTGQKVKEVEFSGQTTIRLDLQAGLYMVKITSGNQSTTRRLIVK